MMQLEELLSMNISEASSAVRKLTTEEMDILQAAAIEKPSVVRCYFAKLVVYRHESMRLLSLLDIGDLNLCRCCTRYLKIHAIRKDLLSKLVSVEEFCKLYNSCCDFGRNALLETLVWNKNRDENCLADSLMRDASLTLNSYQEKLLINACSINVFIDKHKSNQGKKKYYRINGKLCDRVAINKLYEISLKKDDYENSDDYETTCNSLVPFIRNVWSSIEIDGKKIRIYDLLLDLWKHEKQNSAIISQFICGNISILMKMKQLLFYSLDSKDLSSNSMKMKSQFTSLNNFVEYISKAAPVYCYKYFHLNEMGEEKDDVSIASLLVLYQKALILGEEAIMEDVIQSLTNLQILPTNYTYEVHSSYKLIKNVLKPDHFSQYVNKLQDVVLAKMKSITPAKDIIYTSIPCAIYFLLHELTIQSSKNQEILDLFFAFEKQHIAYYNITFLFGFYGLYNQEVPLDFPYQLAQKNLNDTYKTCRKWESILCLKGNSHLNTKDASDRMTILKLLLQFAAQSHDVRALDRCFRLYARTEMKFNDISLELESLRFIFSPDALGLSPLSLEMSGSAEEAEMARQSILQMISEWALSKKGNLMVRPLSIILTSLYYYATLYPEYEEKYCALMKPLCEFLVNANLNYTKNAMASLQLATERSEFFTEPYCKTHLYEKLMTFKEVTNYKNFEKYLDGSLEKRYYGSSILSSVTTFKCTCPREDLPIPALAKKPLYMLLEYLNKEQVQHQYVSMLFDYLIASVIISTEEFRVEQEDVAEYPDNKQKLVRKTVTYFSTGDRHVIKEMFEDPSIEWNFKISGFTVLESLHKLYKVDSFKYCSISQKRTSLELVDCPAPKKSKPSKKEKLSNKEMLRQYLIQNNPQLISGMLHMALKDTLEGYTNLAAMMKLDISMNSLERLLSLSLPTQDLFTLCDTTASLKEIPTLLKLLDTECLKDLQKIVSLRTALTFQTILMAVSINKSDKPILNPTIISKIPALQPVLLQACEILILVNKECTRRNLAHSQVFAIQTICPFLFDWLTSVNENKVQSFFDMKKEETVEFATASKLSIDLDFSQNHIVCRLVELLVYSRGIKEIFGKSVTGLAHIATLVSSHIALILCRRFVIVSSFVHIAESVIEQLLMTASSQSAIITDIISMIADSSSCITVALIGLLFRLASKPIMQAHQALMMKTITKVTNYIIENDFKSEDVYIFILKWICTQVLESDNINLPFIQELLDKIAKLNLNEAAGKSVFGFVSLLALIAYEKRPRPLCRLVNSMDLLESIENVYKLASEEKQDVFDDLFIRIVPHFNTREDEDLFIAQQDVIQTAGYVGDYPELLDYCRTVLQTIYIPRNNQADMFSAAASLLVLNECEDAEALVNQAFAVYQQLKYLKKQSNTISTSKEYLALGIPAEMNQVMDEASFCCNLISPLAERDYDKLFILSRLVTEDPVYQAYVKWASCVLECLPKDATDFDEINMDRLVEVAEEKLEPWMFVVLRKYMDALFYFSDEQVIRSLELFNEKKTPTSAFIVLRSSEEHYVDSVSHKCTEIHSWIKENKVFDLFCFLSN